MGLAMAVRISPVGRQQFFSNQGAVAAGMKLFTYAATTTTKLATFTDSTGNTQNANPIVLDSAGRTPSGLWLTDGTLYKFVLAPANDTDPPSSPIWTEDNIQSNDPSLASLANTSNSALGDALVGVKRTTTGAIATTGHSWLEQQAFNVKSDFGAVGDNSTDDTAAIQAACNAISSGGIIYFPPGTYKVTGAITISAGGRLVGAGRALSIIATTSGTANVFTVSATAAVSFEKLQITSGVVRSAGAGIQFTHGTTENVGSTVDDCIIGNQFRGLHFLRAQQWKVSKCYIADSYSIGVYVQNTYNVDSGDSSITESTFDNSRGGTTYALFQGSGGGLRFCNNKILSHTYGVFFDLESAATTGILLIEGNSIEGQTTTAIDVENANSNGGFTHVIIKGNQISGAANGVVTSGGSDFLNSVIIEGNSISVSSGGTCVSLSRGIKVYVGGNVYIGNGGSPIGLIAGSQISNLMFGTDVSQGISAGSKYQISASTYTHVQLRGQGAAVASANSLTLGNDGDYYQVAGATQINLLDKTGWVGGDRITFKFNSTPTVKHNQAASGNFRPILLVGAADFVATANDTLSIVYDATDNSFYETGRAVI